MATGRVKWFHKPKGIGFIVPEDGGREVFIHYSNIVGDSRRSLERGEPVEFVLRDTPKGPQAFRARALR